MTEIRLLLCATCAGDDDRAAALEVIRAALRRAGLEDRVALALQDCMGACDAPVTLGLQGRGRASYVFAGLDPVRDAADIARTCRACLDAPGGWIEDARGCGRLRLCLRARLPALGDH